MGARQQRAKARGGDKLTFARWGGAAQARVVGEARQAPHPVDGFGGGVGVVDALMLRMWPCGLGLMGPSVGELAPLPCVGLWRSMVLGERRSRSEKLALDRLESNGMGGGGGVLVRVWLLLEP